MCRFSLVARIFFEHLSETHFCYNSPGVFEHSSISCLQHFIQKSICDQHLWRSLSVNSCELVPHRISSSFSILPARHSQILGTSHHGIVNIGNIPLYHIETSPGKIWTLILYNLSLYNGPQNCRSHHLQAIGVSQCTLLACPRETVEDLFPHVTA